MRPTNGEQVLSGRVSTILAESVKATTTVPISKLIHNLLHEHQLAVDPNYRAKCEATSQLLYYGSKHQSSHGPGLG